jgi:transposase InsO family protein
MDARRRLASLVLESGWSVTAAAADAGVSRQTAYLWLGRARVGGVAAIEEMPRRPLRSPRRAPEGIARAVLEAAEQYPAWGPRTLRAVLWPAGEAPVCERTVARILARAGRRAMPAYRPARSPIHFERAHPNELWQTDFKRVGHTAARRDTLSVLDDASRFCLALQPLPDQTLESAWSALWEAFGEYGLPQQILSDNGAAFRNNATWRWSLFDLKLMLLGIRSTHGRPYHPQTQGKVERFHGTIERELRFARASDVEAELQAFRTRYNWARPHQALELRTPGSVYAPSLRARPDRMPEPFFPQGAIIRKVHEGGWLSYRGERYKVGRALQGLPIGILETTTPALVWGDFILAPLDDLKV